MLLANQLADWLSLPVEYIERIGRTASHLYKQFEIQRRGGDGVRTIFHPARELKLLQRVLSDTLIRRLDVHSAAYAYRLGKGIVDCARVHSEGRYLLRLDFEDFFPSILSADIEALMKDAHGVTAEWQQEDFRLFTSLVCRRHALTIGAPCSPALSNAVCFELDTRISEVCQSIGVRYTRYADDLHFSSTQRDVLGSISGQVEGIVKQLRYPRHLKLNHEKTLHTSRKHRRVVLGLSLTSDGRVSIGRERKRNISAQLHQFDNLDAPRRAHLAGMLAFAKNAEPSFITRLAQKHGPDLVTRAFRVVPSSDNDEF